MKLTDEQELILKECHKNIYVSAAPGSGKSTLLSYIADKLLKDDPKNFVLLISFTNKAARSIISKCEKVDQKRILGGTFHGLANLFFKQNNIFLNICDEGKQRLIIKKIFNCKKDKTKFEEINDEISKAKSSWPMKISEKVIRYNTELKTYSLVDFDDIIYCIIDSLPSLNIPPITHILVDELQDTSGPQLEMLKVLQKKLNCSMIGVADDDQCLVEGSLIKTKEGLKKIEDITVGEEIETLVKKKVGFEKVTNISSKTKLRTYEIITENSIIETTGDHTFFVDPVCENNKYYVYLMYRYDIGYRVGVSKGDPNIRSRGEKADFIWIINFYNSLEEARYNESRLSLKYSMPQCTYVEHSKYQFMNNYKKLFNEFGQNGKDLLKDLGYSNNSVCQKKSCKRDVLSIIINSCPSKSYAEVQCESELLKNYIGKNFKITKKRRNTYGFRKYFNSFKQAYKETSEEMIRLLQSGIKQIEGQERIIINNKRYITLDANQLKEGFYLLDANLKPVKVLKINKKFGEKKVYDLEVEKTGKYFANGILVHNCIYQWRGARSENVQDFITGFGCTILNMGYNFRSSSLIVQCSRRLIELNKKRIKKTIKEFKTDKGIVSKYESKNPIDEISYIISKCRQNRDQEIAILYRNRSFKNHLEFELKKAGFKYFVNDSLEISDRSAIKVMISSMKIAAQIGDIYDLETASKGLRGIGATTITSLKKELKDRKLADLLKDKFFDPKNHKKFDSLISIISYFNNHKGNNLEHLALFIEKYFIKSFDYQDDMKNFIHDITKEYLINASEIRDISNDLGLDGKEENQDKNAKIELSTIHGYKGIEREIVILPWCNMFDPQFGKPYEVEDERRLFYVGITRAKSKLYLSYSGELPRFVKEMKI